MTAVSILHAIVASAANPLKTDTAAEPSGPASESVFKGQLEDAILSWIKSETKDAKRESASDDDAREPATGNEDHPPLPILVTIVAAILPPPAPASFGLPAAGLEPGSNSERGSNQTELMASPELMVAAPGNKTAQPAVAAPLDPQADLVFALRLGSPATKDVEVEQARPVVASRPSDPVRQTTPQKYQPVEPTPVQPAAAVPYNPERQRGDGPFTTSPEAASQPSLRVQPAKEIQPARPTTAPPVIARVAQREGEAPETAAKQSSDNPAPPRVAQPTQPEVERKPLRESGATPAPLDSVHKETPLPIPGPPHAAAVSVSIASMPEPPASVAAAPSAAAAPPAAPNSPSSEVTDVSVTLLAPRADSTGEDRVAIRMVQKGAEIHVTVRTPDPQLSQTLRQDLGRLATGLNEAGFRTETWRPVVTGVATWSQSSASQESSPGAPNRDSSGSDARSGGHTGHDPGEQKRRQQDQRPRWVAELEQYKNQ